MLPRRRTSSRGARRKCARGRDASASSGRVPIPVAGLRNSIPSLHGYFRLTTRPSTSRYWVSGAPTRASLAPVDRDPIRVSAKRGCFLTPSLCRGSRGHGSLQPGGPICVQAIFSSFSGGTRSRQDAAGIWEGKPGREMRALFSFATTLCPTSTFRSPAGSPGWPSVSHRS